MCYFSFSAKKNPIQLNEQNSSKLIKKLFFAHHYIKFAIGYHLCCYRIETIKEYGYVLIPGRFVGAAAVGDGGIPFEEKMSMLSAKFYKQFEKADQLEATIKKNLEFLGYAK